MDAACKVVQARDDVVVDAEWKRHSSAMLAKDTEGKILKRIRVLSDSGVSPEVICGIMGVQSYEGGCTCPSDLTPFHALSKTIRALISDGSGTSASEVESSLSCTSKDSVSLLELGRRTRMKKRRKTSVKASMMMSGDMLKSCATADRGGGKGTVGNIVKQTKQDTEKDAQRADRATGRVMTGTLWSIFNIRKHSKTFSMKLTGTGIVIGAASTPVALAFGIVWGTFKTIGEEFKNWNEINTCELIMEKAYKALTTPEPSPGGATVWDRVTSSPYWEKYERAMEDLVGGTFNVDREQAPIPELLESSTFKSTVRFLLNVVPIPGPDAVVAAAKEGFDHFFRKGLSDTTKYRTIAVLYMLRAFYAEALLRHEVGTGERKTGNYLDVFHDELLELVGYMNSDRGTGGFLGWDVACIGVRAGKVDGDQKEYCQLLNAFTDAQSAFVETYLNVNHESDVHLRGGGDGAHSDDHGRGSKSPDD